MPLIAIDKSLAREGEGGGVKSGEGVGGREGRGEANRQKKLEKVI